ncbi:MAG: hypothetical protein WB987_01130 [Candidatus Acidiferrales bacterium]
MFSKCANPDCSTQFDFHQGQFFRFHNGHVDVEPGAKNHAVQHFWLCERCCETYTLRYEERRGVLISACSGEFRQRGMARVIAAA